MLRRQIEAREPGFAGPLFVFEQQSCPSKEEMMSAALRKTFKGLVEANEARRSKVGADNLVVGMECGASDAFSGISANPVLGFAGDLTVGAGGSVILSEFSELAGVEEELAARCANRDVAGRFLQLMAWYGRAAETSNVRLDMNASPGNIRDGLINGIMKSAGAAQKGGTSPIVDVLDYPEVVTKKGLNLLCTPGSDVESTTAMAGAGANIILFSTGLGTPTGNPVCPVIKVSSHSGLRRRLPDLIDFDAGTVLTGEESLETSGRRLFDYLLGVAGGLERTKSIGNHDFMPWKRDVSL
jgi:altronate hydrolase